MIDRICMHGNVNETIFYTELYVEVVYTYSQRYILFSYTRLKRHSVEMRFGDLLTKLKTYKLTISLKYSTF